MQAGLLMVFQNVQDSMSSDRVPVVARLGARRMSFAQKPCAEMASDCFRKMKGYGDYADNAALLLDTGVADPANADRNAACPRRLRAVVGDLNGSTP